MAIYKNGKEARAKFERTMGWDDLRGFPIGLDKWMNGGLDAPNGLCAKYIIAGELSPAICGTTGMRRR